MLAKIKALLANQYVMLTAILLFGFTIRIWGMGNAETFHDEGTYAFRSIGYVDYIQNEYQTTPIQWFKDAPALPGWTKLSFHDHPPLYFLVQHVFFRSFGDSLFVARLPSLIAGMFAILLMFLIGKKLFQNERAGILSAFLLSINHIHIWASRTSITESLLLTLMLANIYFFLRLTEDKKWWFLFGLTLGLSFLTKYTAVALVPVYLMYLLIFHRDYFRAWQLYLSGLVALVLFSPVIVYNIYLFKTVQHFDLQLAYLFKQVAPQWQASLGKVLDPFRTAFMPNMLAMYSKPFLLAAIIGFFASIFAWRKSSKDDRKTFIFLWLGIALTTLMLVKIGAGIRFLTLYIPFAIFMAAYAFLAVKKAINNKIFFGAILAVFVIFDGWFMISGIFIEFPHLGVVEVDQYLTQVFGSGRSAKLPQSPNPHLEAVIERYARNMSSDEKAKMIVYDENIILSAKLWLFTRRLYYHGIPAVTVAQFKQLMRERGVPYFHAYDIYFVKANERSTVIEPARATADAIELETFLTTQLRISPVFTAEGEQPKVGGGMERVRMLTVYKIEL